MDVHTYGLNTVERPAEIGVARGNEQPPALKGRERALNDQTKAIIGSLTGTQWTILKNIQEVTSPR